MTALPPPAAIGHRRARRVFRPFAGAVSGRLDLRTCAVCCGLVAAAMLIALLTLVSGAYVVSIGDVVSALLGRAEGPTYMVVIEWRLPRTGLALLLGAALGLAGAIFQSLTRNPLGSPDIIGFDAGAYAGALVVIILLQGNDYAVAGGALWGGLLTALVVYALAYRRGVQGFRLIIVGIGMSAMLHSFNTWMLLRAQLEVAMSAAVWGAGSLNGLGVERLLPAGLMLSAMAIAALLLARPMAQLELGDETARALGVNVEPARLALLVLGVALTATVTATAGPIAFVALAAPQLARRLTGGAGLAMLPSAAMGALVLVSADFVAQHAFAPTQLPVGVVTISLGGIYLIWLLLAEARRPERTNP